MIFIDASSPKTVADELKKVRKDVIFKHDIFRPGTDDSVWLRKVGVEGWGLPTTSTSEPVLVNVTPQ